MRIINILLLLLNLGFIIYLKDNKNISFSIEHNKHISSEWKIVKISDGDTITVNNNKEERRIRLCGIDAPEKKQPKGLESKKFLENLVNNKELTITFIEQDRYQRWIGEVFIYANTNKEIFVNKEMVENGYAWPYKEYWNNCPNKNAIAEAEKIANELKTGIWLNPENIPPWEWRKNH